MMLGTSAPLDALDETVDRLTRLPVPEQDTPDVVGRTRHAIRRLQDWTRGLLAEAEPGEGDAYILQETRHATRSYNTARLLTDIADTLSYDLPHTLRTLIDQGVLRVEWRWTELERWRSAHPFTLVKAAREIVGDDLDGPHVGEVWHARLDVRGKEG